MYAINAKSARRIALEEVASTNEYAKGLCGEKNCIITAKRQSGGRGTKGRSFSSEEGGVYLTHLRRYDGFPAKNAFYVMVNSAVAVCATLKSYGLQPTIKWPNDIHLSGKKVCGILIENTFRGGEISASIVGIGLNVCNPLPTELAQIATTMRLEGVIASVEEVTERLIFELSKPRTIEEYRAYLGYVGWEITLLTGDERIPATLLGVTDEGKLQAEINGAVKEISSAEVSVRV